MAKAKTRFVCQSCGYVSVKWWGRCPECGEWSSLVEEPVADKVARGKGEPEPAVPLAQVSGQESSRLVTGLNEFDRVLGGGIVRGSLVLLGGDPGIGKSTLLLQVASRVALLGIPVLYVSAEESARQVKLRAERLGVNQPGIMLVTNQLLDDLPHYMENIKPGLVIVDSIQTVYSGQIDSAPGSVGQLRENAGLLMKMAKTTEIPFFIIGHVTKEGYLAGPRVLEHLVDTVIYFEGEKNYAYRILRAVKNRFGSTDEIGILEMTARGLVGVDNPSLVFMGEHGENLPGCALVTSLEGTRPLVLEVQSLVATATGGYPRRMAGGMDASRLSLMIAILEKHVAKQIGALDVYARVTGGVFVRDPAIDLGLAAAVLSSYRDVPCSRDTVYIGEVGLTGEVRPVPFMEGRLKEAVSLGLRRAVVPSMVAHDRSSSALKLEMIGISSVLELV